ncbi:MAG TPA: carcinine hydrolase/isopenicillin-N N-acyltransferase family protein, partial [Myxococcota bacterium]
MPVPRFFGAGYTPFIVNQLVLENCASVDEAIEFIANLPKQQGATYMVADKDKAAFIETVPSPYAPD